MTITMSRKSGGERLYNGPGSTEFTVLDFWQWSASDILGNAMRGRFAEFIVACALKLESGVRTEWDAFDLCTAEGTRIEVKSASYIQSWHQSKHSSISSAFEPRWDGTLQRIVRQRPRAGKHRFMYSVCSTIRTSKRSIRSICPNGVFMCCRHLY